MSTLKSTIERLATEFALSMIDAIRVASIDELMELGALGARARSGRPTADVVRKRGRDQRLGRRTGADIGRMLDGIVSLLQKHPEGLRAEQIREALKCQAKELPRPLADGLSEGRISKSGQKRATTYFAGASAGEGAPKKRRGGRRARA